MDDLPTWVFATALIVVFSAWAVFIIWAYFDEKKNPSPPATWSSLIAFGIGFSAITLYTRFPDKAARLQDALISLFWL